MKKIVLLFLLLSSIVYLESFVGSSNATSAITFQKDAWKTYKKDNFSVQYPANWTLDESGQVGSSFVITSPPADSGGLGANINLIIQNLKGKKINIDKFKSITEDQVKKMLTNSNIIESKKVTDEKGEHLEFVYTGDFSGIHLQWKQYCWVIKEKAYVLTLTTKQKNYDKYLAQADKIFNSFKIK